MTRYVATIGLLAITFMAAPAFAITPQQKMAICKFGADNQKLAGAARKAFIAKCMANDDGPGQPATTESGR